MPKFQKFLRLTFLGLYYISYFNRSSKKISYQQNTKSYTKFFKIGAIPFLSAFIKTQKSDLSSISKNKTDAEKKILQSIREAQEYILNGNLQEAKHILKDAIKIADDNESFENISYLCDLLSSIILSEGDFYEAESVLVKFTERLLQLGYSETHNTIVTFKLKLARIYQLLGSLEMAEYGFRDCIRVQENKLQELKQLDEESNGIYLTALFWYGKLLADQKDFNKARQKYKCCWKRILKSTTVVPAQKMVVLHSIANVSASLNDFDEALDYLNAALEICISEDPNNKDLPILVVQVGLILIQKQVYESALLWCQAGHELATFEGNEMAKKEGEKCLKELTKLKIIPS